MSESEHQSPGRKDSNIIERTTPYLDRERKPSAFVEYKSPYSESNHKIWIMNKTPQIALQSDKKDRLDVNVSPLCKELFQQIKQMGNWSKDSQRQYHLSSPKSINEMAISISPAQNDSFSGFQKDGFQLKNESDQKHCKMIDFPYPETLLSKYNSSKKKNLKKMMKSGDIDDEGCLKRRLFEKESIEYDVDENSNYNILNYNDTMNYGENMITPPPKNSRKVINVPTDQKLSGVKYFQNDSLEKVQQIDQINGVYYNVHPMAQYIPQVIYKSYKCKQTTYPYLIPFCNKCNLPPILPIHPDYEMEMIPPAPLPHGHQMNPAREREHMPQSNSTPIGKPRNKHKNKKKSWVDEHGKKIIRRRKRKTYEQLQQLVKEFQANPEWSKDNMQEVSHRTGLSEAQVYKWGWDQKRKMMDPTHDIHAELRLYKKQQDEEEEQERANVRKLRLPSSSTISNKKPGSKGELATPNEKFIIKTRTNGSNDKENMRNNENHHKTGTRGVKRKHPF
jgi:hypothetical protein